LAAATTPLPVVVRPEDCARAPRALGPYANVLARHAAMIARATARGATHYCALPVRADTT
jgi:hypothetical protein